MAPSPMGGAEQVVLDLTRAQAARGAGVHVLALLGLDERDHPFLRRVADDVEVEPVFLPPRAYRQEGRAVRDAVRRIQPSVVHTHGYRSDVIAGRAARAEGVTAITTVHGFTGGGFRNRLYEWLQHRSFRKFDRVVAVSGVLAAELAGRGLSEARIATIPNARSEPEGILNRIDARRALEAPDDSFHVGWIGRMSREKAPDIMLAALEALTARGRVPRLHATLIGDGRERSALEARTRDLGLAHQIRWAGSLQDAARYMKAFDALVLSSRTEGTPIVGLEALMLEVPLVATRVGGVPALTGPDGALLVPSEDPGALARAIEEVHDDPDAAIRRAAAGKRRIDEIASPARWADQYLELYREAAVDSDRTLAEEHDGHRLQHDP